MKLDKGTTYTIKRDNLDEYTAAAKKLEGDGCQYVYIDLKARNAAYLLHRACEIAKMVKQLHDYGECIDGLKPHILIVNECDLGVGNDTYNYQQKKNNLMSMIADTNVIFIVVRGGDNI